MRTWTIYLACSEAEKVWNPYRNENFDTYPAKRVARAERQTLKFSAELERRMDERDAIRPALTRISDAYHEWIVVSSPPEEAAAFGLLEAAIFDANTALGREDMFNS